MSVDYAAAINALETAIATGVTRVEYSGRTVIYQSIPDMVAAANYFRRQLNAAQPGQPAPAARERTTWGTFGRD